MCEMLIGGELDYFIGDYLVELIMLIFGCDCMKNFDCGYVKIFLVQFEDCLGLVYDCGVCIVINVGGLNFVGLVNVVWVLVVCLGILVQVVYVEGDDL